MARCLLKVIMKGISMEPKATANAKELITVRLVSHHALAVKHLLQELEKDPGILVQVTDDLMLSREALEDGDVIVLDSYGLGALPTEYIRVRQNRFGNARYIILDRTFEVPIIHQLLNLGVQGFVTYDEVADFLVIAVRAVYSGGTWVDAAVLQRYIKPNRRIRDSLQAVKQESLTAREEEILQLARQRLSNKEIAAFLGIEVSTVKFHLSNIFSKMNICSRSDLWRNSIHVMEQPSVHDVALEKASGAASPAFS